MQVLVLIAVNALNKVVQIYHPQHITSFFEIDQIPFEIDQTNGFHIVFKSKSHIIYVVG